MKNLFAISILGSSLLLLSNALKAEEYDHYGIKKHDQSWSNKAQYIELYGINSKTGNKTLITTYGKSDNENDAAFPDHFSPSLFDINSQTGSVVIAGSTKLHTYNFSQKAWTVETYSDDWRHNSNIHSFMEIPSVVGSSNGDVAIELGGAKLFEKKANGELHIGENSWITKEENGKQKVWAKDAAGNSIPIDYTNGTKLLINGRDVEQSINNVGALSAALTGLPTVPTDTTLACGLGTGTHGGDIAFSGGCASKVNEKLSINYAASVTMPGQDYAGDFEDQFSARAGFVWKLGKATKPTQISMKDKKVMETKIESLEKKNKTILSKNQKLENKLSILMARLEKIEKIALGESKSKDLAVYKLQ
ncbi:YadA C-terminal domain-containing protein [Prochlorococcus sp. AH-716-M10]|nr:YadA C-terminal domain-containing protein [Prochlorococcus sp. AH-716-M10]